MTTILDVVDNFFTAHKSVGLLTGRELMEFGEEVKRFSAAYDPPALRPEEHPIYVGGWPSANFWTALNSELVMSTMLYSGQILVRDPLTDWFSRERYDLPVLHASRGGYLDAGGDPAVASTRQFLSVVIPALQEMRPLIESEVLVLAPYRGFLVDHRDDIQELTDLLAPELSGDPLTFSRDFDPRELAVEDNVRGMFVFAGGNREEQVRQKIRAAVEYFAGEYAFALVNGAHYTAPFRFEAHVCGQVLEKSLLKGPSERTVNALFRSKLPAFRGLTPRVVAKVREDDNFAFFRADLYNTYRDIPTEVSQQDVDRYIAEAEAALLKPKIDRVLREADRGKFSTIVQGVAGFGLRFGASMLVSSATAGASLPAQVMATVGAEGASSVWRRLRARARVPDLTRTIWKTLGDHGRTIETELTDVETKENPAGAYWGIPEDPSMQVKVTGGMIIHDFVPRFATPDQSGGPDNPYWECGCGSGYKWRFCCRGIREV